MPRLMLNVPYSELYGTKPRFGEVIQEFGKFRMEEVIRLLSKLNYVLSENEDNAQQQAIEYLLSPETQKRMGNYSRRGQAQILPFYRQQILTAIKLAFLSQTGSTEKSVEDVTSRHELGDLLLQVTDLCSPTSSFQVTSDLIGQPATVNQDFSIATNLENEPDLDRHLVRYYKLLFTFIPQALQGKGLAPDLWERSFEASYGCSLRDVFSLANMLFLHFYAQRKKGYAGQHSWFERDAFFRNIQWQPERIDRTLAHMAADWQTFPNLLLLEQSLPFYTDFAVFQRKPLVIDGPGFQVIDRRSLMGMFGEQLLRQVRSAIPVRDQQDQYGSVLGEAFESYVRWVMRHAFPKSDQLVDRVQQPSEKGSKFPDIEILDTPVHAYLEVKGMLFSDHAVFSNDPQLFALELYRNYAQATGVKQLAQYVATIQKRSRADRPARIQPVLLGLDRSLSALGVHSTLQLAFKTHLEALGGALDPLDGPLVSKLTVLTAEDMELIAAMVENGTRIKDILDGIIAHDQQGMLSAHDALATSRYRVTPRPGFITDTLREWQVQIAEMFDQESDVELQEGVSSNAPVPASIDYPSQES
ncbi:MAG: hypothetical protein JWL77_2801 [Chthonomonadaceae bacterium]|nr:hypothetical protein [Chthonomonadaceae bacterium]